jgi:hypothetical protein
MSGPNCEYGVCKNTIAEEVSDQTTVVQKESITREDALPLAPSAIEKKPRKTSLFSSLVEKITQVTENVIHPISSSFNNGQTDTSVTNNQTGSAFSPTEEAVVTSLNEERFTVVNNTLLDSSGNTVATLPIITGTSSSAATIVNVIEVGQVAPVVNGVPVIGATGKYYVSENSFGTREGCEFSNKIYILDTVAETQTLIFEENSFTLSKDDPRACNSEIFLLATEDEKLILKYHTINTNMTCESTWSEPDKTWYLDITSLPSLMKRYQITSERYSLAESQELLCRADLGAEN